MPTYLDRLIDYNNWANRGLLEFIAAQPPATLDLTTSGVYGTIRDTFEHILSSELGYQRRLRGLPRLDPSDRPVRPDLGELQQLADESAAILGGLIDKLPDPATMLATSSGQRAAATILTQLIMHGVEHRAHIGTILGSNGIEPPDLDSWAHGIRVHADDWPPDWGPEPAER
ncbi:MAG: DinB family protein [Chloroflexi bacterium]|nr:DinB family protein [Chloroflexota bacterium]